MPSSVELAVQAFREQRYPEAVAFFEELLRVQPGNVKIGFSLAQAYQAAGQPAEARRLFTELASAADERIAELSARALEAMGPVEPEAPSEAVAEDSIFCPECGNPVPEERVRAPWCACGWGIRRPKGDECLYIAHLKAMARKLNRSIELKMQGDLYSIDDQVWIKHLSDQMTPIDARQVFRVDQGMPYLLRSDLDRFMPKVDERALFRLGVKGTVGKLMTWEELVEKVASVVPNPDRPPEGGLRTVLAENGTVPAMTLERIEREVGPRRLGAMLLETGTCTLQDLLESVLGAQRVYRPTHHQANQLGPLLLEAGEISEVELRQALISQVKNPKPLRDVLRTQISVPAMRKALTALYRLPIQGPETERIGEVLFAMGALSRTELTQALQERAKRHKLTGKLMVERGMVTEEALVEALKRQELKREMRLEGAVRLGEVLVALKVCEPKVVARALVTQMRDARPLGEILVDSGALSPEHLITAIAEQERRLDALVEQRLPAALKKAKLSDIDLPPRRTRKLDRVPLPDEDEPKKRRKRRPAKNFKRGAEDEANDPGRLPRPLLIAGLAGAVLLAGGLYLAGQHRPAPRVAASALAPAPSAAGSPIPATPGSDARRPVFSTLTAANVVNVDMDKVVERIEKGDPNPLGDAAMGASGSLPIQLQAAAQEAVARQAAGKPAASPGGKTLGGTTFLSTEGVGGLEDEEGPALQTASPQAKLPPKAQEGLRMMSQGNLPGSEKALRVALAQSPGNADLLGQLGDVQRRMGKAPAAEATLDRATQLAPDRPQLWADLGAVRLAKGDAAGAVVAYSRGVKTAPKDAAMHNRLAFSLLKIGRVADSRRSFEDALRVDPSNPNSHLNLGLLKAKEEPKAARQHYEQAIDGFVQLVDSRMAMAGAQKSQGDFRGALGSYRGALRANTLMAQTHLELGKLDLLARDGAGAKEQFALAKVAFGANAIAHDQLGLVHASLKEPKKAESEWLVASRIAPFYAPPLSQLAAYYRVAGRPKEARRYLALAKGAKVKGRLDQLLDSY